MSREYEIRSFDLGRPFFGEDARAQSAKLLDLAQVTGRHELLHYSPEGVSLPNFSPVKFISRKTGFALLGYGEPGLALLDRFAPVLASAWACYTNRPVLQHKQRGECAIRPLPYMLATRVPRLMVQKKPRHRDSLAKDPNARVRTVLMGSFRRQAEFLGLSLPGNFEIDVIECQKVGAHRFAGVAAGAVMDATFACNAMFDGIWSLGYLTAHGQGVYHPALERARALMPSQEAA